MKCEVLIGEDAEAARKEGKRLEWWSDAKASFMPHSPDSFCGSTVFRLAPEQPVPPGNLTTTEARQLAAQGVAVQWWSKMGNVWYDCEDDWQCNLIYPYRRKPETKRVPLGPEDVKTGDRVRNWTSALVAAVVTVDHYNRGFMVCDAGGVRIHKLDSCMDWEISRDDKPFKPMSKEVES